MNPTLPTPMDEASTRPLNYDPTDPDKMNLPKGSTCGDCCHIKRCKSMFGHTETDTSCDWSPSRFVRRATPQGANHEPT